MKVDKLRREKNKQCKSGEEKAVKILKSGKSAGTMDTGWKIADQEYNGNATYDYVKT